MTRPHSPQNRRERSMTAWRMRAAGEPIAEIAKLLRLDRREVTALLRDGHGAGAQHQFVIAQGVST